MGWGFLDDLDAAFDFVKKIGKKTGNTAVDAAQIGPGVPLGAVADIARTAIPGEDSVFDRGPGRYLGLKRGALKSAGDLFASEDTLTGSAISGVAKVAHWVSEHVFLGGLEAAMLHGASRKNGDPLSWKEAYDLGLTRSYGETSLLAETVRRQSGGERIEHWWKRPLGDQALGAEDDKFTDKPLDLRDTSTFEVKGDDGTVHKYQNVVAKAMEKDPEGWAKRVAWEGIGPELADPTFSFAGSGIKSVRAWNAFRLQGKNWAKLAGFVDDAGTHTPGQLDKWNAAEKYTALRLDKVPQGRQFAEILDRAKHLEPESRIAVYDGVARILNKDPSGIALLARHDPLAADEVSNMITGTATGSIEAGLVEDAAAEAGEVFKPLAQPEVVADGLTRAALDPKFEDYVGLMLGGEKTALRTTASGNRALGRLARVGDKADRAILPGGPNRPGVEFMSKGLRTIGWATGVTPSAKAAARLSDNLRDPHVYGALDVNDEHLSIGVVRHMMRTAGVRQGLAEDFISRAINAPTPEARALVVIGAKDAAIHTMAKRHGKDSDFIERLLRASDEDSKALLTSYEGQAYASTTAEATGRRSDIVFLKTDEGDAVLPKPVAAPVYGTQAVNHVAIPDLKRVEFWLKNDDYLGALSRKIESLRGQGVAESVIESTMARGVRDVMESGNGYWKASVLLPRAPAYATRNQVEEYLRAGIARSFLPVVARSVRQQRSLTKTGKLKVDPGEIATDPILRSYRGNFEHALDVRRAELSSIEAMLAGVADDWARLEKAAKRGEDVTSSGDYAYIQGLRAEAKTARDEIAQYEKILGGEKVPDSATFRIPGTNITAEQAYAGDEGRFMFDAIGGKSATADIEMLEYGRRHGNRLRGYSSVIHPSREMTPDELQRYHKAVYEVLNRHIRTDPLGKIALRVRADGGSADDIREAVFAYLRSPAGKATRAKVPTRTNLEQWADAVTTEVDNLVREPELAIRLRNHDATADEIAEFFTPKEGFIPPSVHESGASATFGAQARGLDRAIRWGFEGISRMSTDRLTRHPHFALMYEDDLTQAVHRLIEADITITPPMLKSMQSAARKTALHKLRKTYYQNSERSSAAHQMRFLSPFFAAHQDSVRYWVKAVGENPEWLRKAMVGYSGMQSAGLVTDEEGNQIAPGTFPENDHVIHLGLGSTNWSLHPSSALLMIQQGSLTNPGFGPLAAITVGEFQSRITPSDRDVAKIAKYFLPLGYNGPVRSTEPTWAQRIHEYAVNDSKQNTPELARLYKIQLKDGITDWRLANGDREPTDADIRDIAAAADRKMKTVTMWRAIASVAAPMQPAPQSKYKSLMDEYNRIRDNARITHPEDPFHAEQVFLDKYGDALVALTVSESSIRTGLDPTMATRASMKAHESLRHNVNPALWGMIVGPESKEDPGESGDFDLNTYKHIQEELEKSPEGGERDSAKDYLRDVSVAAGWREFDRNYKLLTNIAVEQGLSGPEESKELSLVVKLLRQKIGEKNPQWRFANDPNAKLREWGSIEEGARLIAKDPKLLRDPARSDIKLLGEYLAVRDQIAAELKRRAAKNEASTIGAKANTDLRLALALHVMNLKAQNTDFETYVMRGVVWRDPFYDEDVLTQVKGVPGADAQTHYARPAA